LTGRRLRNHRVDLRESSLDLCRYVDATRSCRSRGTRTREAAADDRSCESAHARKPGHAAAGGAGDVAENLDNRLDRAGSGPHRPIVTGDSSSRLMSAAAHPCRQLRGWRSRSPEDPYVEPRKTANAPRRAISVNTTAFVTSFSLLLACSGDGGARLPSTSTARRPTPEFLEAAPSPRAATELRAGFGFV
jgi:hypothetical protein